MESNGKRSGAEEDLKFDNEFRKAKLQMENGALFQSESNLPPEVENDFLKGVEEFDKVWDKCKQITVFEKLGRPIFRKANEVPDAELKKEFYSISDKLREKGMSIESIHKVDDREMYRFITEELFKHETDDMSLPGWITHFTYEEFHPNHECDVKDHAWDFVKEILGKRNVEAHLLCSEIKISDDSIITAEEVLRKINAQRSFYSKFEIEQFEISLFEINDEKTIAKVDFDLKYSAIIDGTKERHLFNGKGNAVLKNEYDSNWWTIYQFNAPGFVI